MTDLEANGLIFPSCALNWRRRQPKHTLQVGCFKRTSFRGPSVTHQSLEGSPSAPKISGENMKLLWGCSESFVAS